MDVSEVKRLLVDNCPPGFRDLWRTAIDKGEVGRILEGLARGHKGTAIDWIELLQREINPFTMAANTPGWEKAFGLSQTWVALLGTAFQRQQQVIGKWREGGDATFDNIRAIIQPYFHYADPARIQIIESDRNALRLAHLNLMLLDGALPLPATIPVAVTPIQVLATVSDDARVSPAGAQVFIELSGYLEEIALVLSGPGGQPADSVYFPPGYLGTGQVTSEAFRLDAPELVDRPIRGQWKMTARSNGPHTGTLSAAILFVEGLGRDSVGNDGLGAALFEWGVVYDASLVEPGASSDLRGAYEALVRIKPAHTVVNIILASGGVLYAIPDLPSATPDQGIPA